MGTDWRLFTPLIRELVDYDVESDPRSLSSTEAMMHWVISGSLVLVSVFFFLSSAAKLLVQSDDSIQVAVIHGLISVVLLVGGVMAFKELKDD